MKKYNIVKKNREFNEIINTKKYYKNELYVIYLKHTLNSNYRFGISVGKKIGNAVCRNKLRRQLRYIIDNNKKYYQKNTDYIIMIRKTCIISDFSTLEKRFIDLFKIINMNQQKGEINEK